MTNIYIGLDFGTSFSKVCYDIRREKYVYQRGYDPFIPSVVYFSANENKFYYRNPGKSVPDSIEVKYFKFSMAFSGLPIFMKRSAAPIKPEILCAVFFLACLLHEVKESIRKQLTPIKLTPSPQKEHWYSKLFRHDTEVALPQYAEKEVVVSSVNFHHTLSSEIQLNEPAENDLPTWFVNMGVPLDNINDVQEENYRLYWHTLVTAFELSDHIDPSEGVSLDKLNEAYVGIIRTKIDENHPQYYGLKIYPEFFMEAVFFTQDRSTPEGIYVITDIGGGTVDTVILWKRNWMSSSQENELKFDPVAHGISHCGVEVLVQKLLTTGNSVAKLKSVLKTLRSSTAYIHLLSDKANEVKRVFSRTCGNAELIVSEIQLSSWNSPVFILCGGGFDYQWYTSTLEIDPPKSNFQNLRFTNYSNSKTFHRLITAAMLAQRDIPSSAGITIDITPFNADTDAKIKERASTKAIPDLPSSKKKHEEDDYYRTWGRQNELYSD